MTKTPRKTVIIRVSERARRALKTAAAKKGLTMVQYVDLITKS